MVNILREKHITIVNYIKPSDNPMTYKHKKAIPNPFQSIGMAFIY